MCPLPIVKSFCGCCDLKAACIIIAALHLIISIIVVLGLVILAVSGRFIDFETFALNAGTILVIVIWILAIALFVTDIVFSYWFILGATAVNQLIPLISFWISHNKTILTEQTVENGLICAWMYS